MGLAPMGVSETYYYASNGRTAQARAAMMAPNFGRSISPKHLI